MGRIGDSHYLVEISIRRISATDYQGKVARNTGSPDAETTPSRWLGSPHDTISKWGDGPYSSFRYDVHCGNGDVLWGAATLTHYYRDGVSQFGKDDEAVIRRILASMTCVEEPGSDRGREALPPAE
jgi:hypothetical protein